MADTSRPRSELESLLADNTNGEISAQDVRDFLASTFVKLDGYIPLTGQASDPESPADGTFWYNSTTKEFRIRVDGVTYKLVAAVI